MFLKQLAQYFGLRGQRPLPKSRISGAALPSNGAAHSLQRGSLGRCLKNLRPRRNHGLMTRSPLPPPALVAFR